MKIGDEKSFRFYSGRDKLCLQILINVKSCIAEPSEVLPINPI
jgi:hypothetical protein